MSAYPAGYIEQLARPFRPRAAAHERARVRAGRDEQGAGDSLADVRRASRLDPDADAR